MKGIVMRLIRMMCGYLILISGAQMCMAQLDCSQFNTKSTTPYTALADNAEHKRLQPFGHGITGAGYSSCTYSGNPGSACSVSCSDNWSYAVPFENSTSNPISPLFTKHAVGWNGITGSGRATPGSGVTCGATVAYSAVSCSIMSPTCYAPVSVSAGANGLNAVISYPPVNISANADNDTNVCGPETAPALPPICTPGGGGTQAEPDPPVGTQCQVWDTNSCSWVWEQCQNGTGTSPILIDTDGSGFHLTSASNGVLFDFYGSGKPIQIAWTAPGSTNGWLALDRNGNGTIDSAKELFGNYTEQPASATPNGFLALAMFDLTAYGGNGNGVIDSGDAIWPQLKVWIDSNHDGISQPGELHSLDDIGIHSIALRYTETKREDAYGNEFRFKGSLNPDTGDSVRSVIYDVILTQASNPQVALAPHVWREKKGIF